MVSVRIFNSFNVKHPILDFYDCYSIHIDSIFTMVGNNLKVENLLLRNLDAENIKQDKKQRIPNLLNSLVQGLNAHTNIINYL